MKAIAALALSAVSLWASGSEARLADAAEAGDRAGVERLIVEGAAVDAAQPDGMTALHWAAYGDDYETAKVLIEAGAEVNVRSRYGVTPLSLAATNGDAALVEALLDAGADPNTQILGGETVLMTAARTGKIDAVRVLIERGADVDAKEYGRGQTAVMWAAAEGHGPVVDALIGAGADFQTPLTSGFTPLFFAVRNGHMDAASRLLEAGADVNSTIQIEERVPGGPRNGSTPLLVAVTNAHFDLAAMLLDAGADPNAAEPGYTVLHAIAAVRKPGVGDNDPAPQGSGRMTSIEFVEYVVRHGADVNMRMTRNVNLGNTSLNKSGATPFLLAAHQADAELMRKLADLGADPDIPTEENTTPLMAAAGIGTRSPGEDAGTEEEVIEALGVALELGADIDAVNDHGDTAMHGAAYKNLPGAVYFLAEKGADINVWHQRDEWGWTPLIIAEGYRFGNFKPSPPTIEALRQVMLERGVTPVSEAAKSQEIY